MHKSAVATRSRVTIGLAAAGLALAIVVGIGLSVWVLAKEALPSPAVARAITRRLAQPTARRDAGANVGAEEAGEDSGDANLPPARELCPGLVRALLPDGSPFVGRLRSEGWVDLQNGEAFAATRGCGATKIRLRGEAGAVDGRLQTDVAVHVHDDEPVEVVVEQWVSAEVETVDGRGERVDARVRPGLQLSPGLYEVLGRAEARRILVGWRGDFGREMDLPLDGDRHVVEVEDDRVVDVTLRCDHCPERLTCEANAQSVGVFTRAVRPCTGASPDWRCPCPPGDATLVARWTDALLDYRDHAQPVGVVPPDVDALILDRSGAPGMVEGRWGRGDGAILHLRRPGSAWQYSGLDDDGGFVLVDLLPGAWELRFAEPGWPNDVILAFDLPPDTVVDLGTITSGD